MGPQRPLQFLLRVKFKTICNASALARRDGAIPFWEHADRDQPEKTRQGGRKRPGMGLRTEKQENRDLIAGRGGMEDKVASGLK